MASTTHNTTRHVNTSETQRNERIAVSMLTALPHDFPLTSSEPLTSLSFMHSTPTRSVAEPSFVKKPRDVARFDREGKENMAAI